MRPQDLKKLKKEKLIADYYLAAANLYKNSFEVLKLNNMLRDMVGTNNSIPTEHVETTARSLKIAQTRVNKYDSVLGTFKEEVIRRNLENEVEWMMEIELI